jgi:hypothetical protein
MQIALGQEPTGGGAPLLSVDGISPEAPDALIPGGSYQRSERTAMYLMLGGPSYRGQRAAEDSWTPSSLLALTQTAQGACAKAVAASAPALFAHATLSSRLPEDEADIRANIAYLHRRFLRVAPEDIEVEETFSEIYVPAESAGTRAAWTQVCTALFRDPLFITF